MSGTHTPGCLFLATNWVNTIAFRFYEHLPFLPFLSTKAVSTSSCGLCKTLAQSLCLLESPTCWETVLPAHTSKSSCKLLQGTKGAFFFRNTMRTGLGFCTQWESQRPQRLPYPLLNPHPSNMRLNLMKLPICSHF